MAEPRKTPARKGPTRAAALKALGLTKEDLDFIKKSREAEGQVVESGPVTLKPVNPTTLPPEGQEFLTSSPTNPEPKSYCVRNARNVEVSLRLESQQGQGKKRFNLKPRGYRGDLAQLKPEDLQDSTLIENVQIGLVEIITAAEARSVIESQHVNVQKAPHPALASIRNELGQEYSPDAIKVEDAYEHQGQTVARLDPDVVAGKRTDKSIKQDGGLTRETVHAPVPGGGIISDGFAARDAVARDKSAEGPEAGIAGLRVTVEDVQKS